MTDVSIFRLYVLRATYLLIATGLGFMIWPNLIDHTSAWALKNGDTFGSFALLPFLGVTSIRNL